MVVSVHPPAASSGYYGVKCAVLVTVIVGRSGAQVRLESKGETELEIKDE